MHVKHSGLGSFGMQPQKILVACPAELFGQIPIALKQALGKQHLDHRFMLVSDLNPHQCGSVGMKRWCGGMITNDAGATAACLDSHDPSHLLLVASTTSMKSVPIWMERLRREAERRLIACTTVCCKP